VKARAKKTEEPILAFEGVAEWNAWLKANHAKADAVLLRLAKKKGTEKVLTYAEALGAALTWGWIDSQKRALDATAWLQRFSRRTATSPWSKINRKKAEELIAAKSMAAPGLAEVERARKDGRWERAYDGAKSSVVPPDLVAALAKNARARVFFEGLDGTNRYAILFRVQTAKRPETRAERIQRFVSMCARHETLHPPRRGRRVQAAKSTK